MLLPKRSKKKSPLYREDYPVQVKGIRRKGPLPPVTLYCSTGKHFYTIALYLQPGVVKLRKFSVYTHVQYLSVAQQHNLLLILNFRPNDPATGSSQVERDSFLQVQVSSGQSAVPRIKI